MPAPQRKPVHLEVGVALGLDHDFTSTKPAAFELAGQRYEAASWQDLMITLSKLMRERDPARFSEVVRTGLKEGRQRRRMFAADPNELSYDVELGEGAYFEGQLSANGVVGLAKRLLAYFGMDSEIMTVELRR
jgi:hypothetical protein